MTLKAWKDGRLEPCDLSEFIQSLRRYAGWADENCGARSDPSAHLGERLNAAADALEAHGVAQAVPAPVAWRLTDGEGDYEYLTEEPSDQSRAWSRRYGREWEPLYASPVLSTVREGDRRIDETGPEYEARIGKLVTGTPLTAWPLGCHSPNSCHRNGRCMYVGCKHDGTTAMTSTNAGGAAK